jgi:hypothetical protein
MYNLPYHTNDQIDQEARSHILPYFRDMCSTLSLGILGVPDLEYGVCEVRDRYRR